MITIDFSFFLFFLLILYIQHALVLPSNIQHFSFLIIFFFHFFRKRKHFEFFNVFSSSSSLSSAYTCVEWYVCEEHCKEQLMWKPQNMFMRYTHTSIEISRYVIEIYVNLRHRMIGKSVDLILNCLWRLWVLTHVFNKLLFFFEMCK